MKENDVFIYNNISTRKWVLFSDLNERFQDTEKMNFPKLTFRRGEFRIEGSACTETPTTDVYFD